MVDQYSPEKSPKGMEIDECVSRAARFISRSGACLLLMDVVGSKHHPDRVKLFDDYQQLLADLNREFDEYLPKNDLAAAGRRERGFNMILGDGASAGINDSEVIPRIVHFAGENYPAVELRYAVAEDGYDGEGTRLVK